MKELDNLRNVVQVAVNEALEPVNVIRSQLEAGLKKQQDVSSKYNQKCSDLITKFSQGEKVETQIKKAGREVVDADQLIDAYTKSLALNGNELEKYRPVMAQVQLVLTGATTCIEIKRMVAQLETVNRATVHHEKQLKAELHSLGKKSQRLLALMDTPEINKALNELIKAVINFEIIIRNSTEDFDANEYIPSTNNKIIKEVTA